MSAALILVLAASTGSAQDTLEERRDKIAARLESLRGLKFKKPLPIRKGTRREYALYTLGNAERVYGKDLAAAEKGMKALGLIPRVMKLKLVLTLPTGAAPKAFWSGKDLLLLDPKAPEDWILNKMTLGLIDQHFEPELEQTFDAQMAYAALRMGDAEFSKHLLWFSNTIPEGHAAKMAGEARTWERGASKLASAIVPRIFVRSSGFSWRRGVVFALALHERDGLKELNRTYARPPRSTEQVLHPEKYFSDETPVRIDLEPAATFLKDLGYEETYATVLGELGCALVLETHLAGKDLEAASEGWAGDRFGVFEKEGAPSLVLWATEWDSVEDAAEFQTEAVQTAAKLGAAEGKKTYVLRRNASVALIVQLPAGAVEGFGKAVWSCGRRGGKTGRYGE